MRKLQPTRATAPGAARRLAVNLFVTAVLAASLGSATAVPAAAEQVSGAITQKESLVEASSRGPDCGPSTGGCSEIQNWSDRNVRVGRDWCGNGTVSVGGPSCGGSGTGNLYKWLRPGQHSRTSAFKDTDTFGIIGGCTMKVQWNVDGQEDAPVSTYRPERTTWYRVFNSNDIDVEYYRC